MARYYALHEANAHLPEVERILVALRDQRADLIALRDRVVALGAGADAGPSAPGSGDAAADGAEAELRRLHLRMQGLVDQMQAGVARLVELEIQLRDIPTGLIDFPALVAGRPIWLCWRLGEGDIAFWHAHDEGFAMRKPLTELATGLPTQ